MPWTVDAVVDEHGNVRILSPVALPAARRAILTILDEPARVEPTPGAAVGDSIVPWGARYEPIRVIGEGGMGRVHLARDRMTGVTVCVKELRGHTRASALQQECRALARLNHPSILRLLNFETRGDDPYLVTEYGRGVPMRRLVEALLLAQEPLAVHVLERLFDAVAFAHGHDVIHRDLKPDNVLVEELDGTVLPKILDFGLAIVDWVDDRNALTGAGMVAGTLHYMAPEQFRGVPVTSACDVYAIGQIGCEMLTGTPAFSGSLHEILEQKMFRDGLAVEPRHLGVSAELADLLFACTRVDERQRPTAESAAATLRALIPHLDAQTNLVPVNLTLAGAIDERPAGWFDGLGRVEGTSMWYESAVVRDLDDALCSRLRRPADEAGDFAVLMERIAAHHLRGATVRFEAQVRAEGLTDWAGLWLRADGPDMQLAFYNMHDRPIRGTTPWTPYAIELPLPEATRWLNFGFLLVGGGTIFMRDARVLSRGTSGYWIPLGLWPAAGHGAEDEPPTLLLT